MTLENYTLLYYIPRNIPNPELRGFCFEAVLRIYEVWYGYGSGFADPYL
jgi:hypothetical protein